MKTSQFSTIDYGEHTIRVMRAGDDGVIGKICLNDLCSIIRKPDWLQSGTATKLCPSLSKESDGNSYATLDEARELLQSARKTFWGGRGANALVGLVDAMIEEAHELAETMQTSAYVEESWLEYQGTRFRVRRTDGHLLFNATEITKSQNKKPFQWKNLNTTVMLKEYLVKNGFVDDEKSLIFSSKGRYGHTWIDHTLMVHFSRWISDEFAAWCEQYLVSEGLFFSEIASIVVESPKKTTIVRTQETLKNLHKPGKSRKMPPFAMPETLSEAQETYKQNYTLMEELMPKAEYYDEQVEYRQWFTNSFIANELGITIRHLNMFLEECGVQERKNDKWVLCAGYRAMPLRTAVPYDNTYARTKSNLRSVWTPYGRDFVHEIWRVKHV